VITVGGNDTSTLPSLVIQITINEKKRKFILDMFIFANVPINKLKDFKAELHFLKAT
jgi:hypothetical protein